MIGVDVVDVDVGGSRAAACPARERHGRGFWPCGRRRAWLGRRRKRHGFLAMTTPASAAGSRQRSTSGNTASKVAPWNGRARREWECFRRMRPGCRALPPRLRAWRRKTGALALERFQDKRLVRLDNSGQRPWLVERGRSRESGAASETPCSGERRSVARPWRRWSPSIIALRVVEPAAPSCAAAPSASSVKALNVRPQPLQRYRAKRVDASPADDVPPPAMRATLGFNLLWPEPSSPSDRTRRSGRSPISPDSAANARRRCAGLSLSIPSSQP